MHDHSEDSCAYKSALEKSDGSSVDALNVATLTPVFSKNTSEVSNGLPFKTREPDLDSQTSMPSSNLPKPSRDQVGKQNDKHYVLLETDADEAMKEQLTKSSKIWKTEIEKVASEKIKISQFQHSQTRTTEIGSKSCNQTVDELHNGSFDLADKENKTQLESLMYDRKIGFDENELNKMVKNFDAVIKNGYAENSKADDKKFVEGKKEKASQFQHFKSLTAEENSSPNEPSVYKQSSKRSSINDSADNSSVKTSKCLQHYEKTDSNQLNSKQISQDSTDTQRKKAESDKSKPMNKTIVKDRRSIPQSQHFRRPVLARRSSSKICKPLLYRLQKLTIERNFVSDVSDKDNKIARESSKRVGKITSDKGFPKKNSLDYADNPVKSVDADKPKIVYRKVVNDKGNELSQVHSNASQLSQTVASVSSLKSVRSSNDELVKQSSQQNAVIKLYHKDDKATPTCVKLDEKIKSDQETFENQMAIVDTSSCKLDAFMVVNKLTSQTSSRSQSVDSFFSLKSNKSLNDLIKQNLEEISVCDVSLKNKTTKTGKDDEKSSDLYKSKKIRVEDANLQTKHAVANKLNPSVKKGVNVYKRSTKLQHYKPSQLPQTTTSSSGAHEPFYDKLQEPSTEQNSVVDKKYEASKYNANEDRGSTDQDSTKKIARDDVATRVKSESTQESKPHVRKSCSSIRPDRVTKNLNVHKGSLEDLAKLRSERRLSLTDDKNITSDPEAARKIVEITKKRVASKEERDSKKGTNTGKRRTSLSSALKQISSSRRASIDEEEEDNSVGASTIFLQDKNSVSATLLMSDNFLQGHYDNVVSHYEIFENCSAEVDNAGKLTNEEQKLNSIVPKNSESPLIRNKPKSNSTTFASSSNELAVKEIFETNSSFFQHSKPVVLSQLVWQSPDMLELLPLSSQSAIVIELSIEEFSEQVFEEQTSMDFLIAHRKSASNRSIVKNIVQVPTNVIRVTNVDAGKLEAEYRKVAENQNKKNSSTQRSKSSLDQNSDLTRSFIHIPTGAGQINKNNIDSLVCESQIRNNVPDNKSKN